jgi:hypothetical protein
MKKYNVVYYITYFKYIFEFFYFLIKLVVKVGVEKSNIKHLGIESTFKKDYFFLFFVR